MRTRFRRLSLLLLVIVLAGFGAVRPSLAEGPDQVSLGIAPLDYSGQYFDLTMAPGESRELKVEVANHGTKQIAARTYAADAYTIINGGFGARLDGEPVTGTTGWIAYPAQTIDLPAGAGLPRSFTVTVPASAGPGEYITSLAVQNAEPTAAGSGGVAIKQVQRQVIAVAITVPGPRQPALTIGSVGHQYLAAKSIFSVTVTNTGNVRLKPSGELVVSEKDGRQVSFVPLTMDSVYAGDTTRIEVPFDQALLPGDYRVTLNLNYEGRTVRATDLPLSVSKPTRAEAGGAPSAAGNAATVNQQRPAAQAGRVSPPVVAAGGAAFTLILALIIVRHRRRRSVVGGPAGPALASRGRPVPFSPAGPSQFEPSRSASAPPSTALRYSLATAGEQEGAPLRPSSRALLPASGPRPSDPQAPDPSKVRPAGNAAPPTGGKQNGVDFSQIERFFGQMSASTPRPRAIGRRESPG